MNTIKLYIAVGASASAQRKGGYLPHAYAVIVEDGMTERELWGYGNYKDSQALFAEALIAALSDRLPDGIDAPREDWSAIEVIAQKTGFWPRIDQHLDREFRGEGGNADQGETWKQAAVMAVLFQLKSARKPATPREEISMARAKQLQENYARVAVAEVPESCAGLYREGGDHEKPES